MLSKFKDMVEKEMFLYEENKIIPKIGDMVKFRSEWAPSSKREGHKSVTDKIGRVIDIKNGKAKVRIQVLSQTTHKYNEKGNEIENDWDGTWIPFSYIEVDYGKKYHTLANGEFAYDNNREVKE